MAKMTAQEKLETEKIIEVFQNTTNQVYEGYAYSAGYLGSLCVSLINELPKAKRAQYRAQLLGTIVDLNNKQNKK